MSRHSPHQSQSQFQYNPSTPPPPPPKPSAHSSGRGTPLAGPPRPPPPGQTEQLFDSRQSGQHYTGGNSASSSQAFPVIPHPEPGWLPDIVKDKSTVDLHHILSAPSLQQALVHAPSTAHPSVPASAAGLSSLLAENIALASSLQALEAQIQHQRQATQSRLLALRALEAQWRAKQAEQDAALRDFSPPALYQQLAAAVVEQETLCNGLEESFLEGEGAAAEREVAEFVRRLREAKKVAYLRRERKERWDEGRVGGWR
ncbi:hypothetical protein EJ06DRAFT_581505 [Trichodelitschia bisporula]|uniref:VPS37 C-terminal domain-containing protein n=1 Tax=Trichodelitschia bisporula TaxID=703511 RepID=A0A6G1HZA6_9PEZI|nr:hypothetical protein EJ06DRAFT_581505 [Trichodelitschia bisporula]